MVRPHKQVGIFRYAGKEVAFVFWYFAEHDSSPDTVLFLGAGQVGSIGRWVTQSVGNNVVVVEGLPHWHAHPSGADIIDFSSLYVRAAFRQVRRRFKRSSMNIIAESQAAPAALLLARHYPRAVRNVVLIRPLGFTVQAFGDSEDARLRTFRRRALKSLLQFSQSLLHDPRNLGIVVIVVGIVLKEPSIASLARKYAAGISYDLLQDCREIVANQKRKGHSLTLLLSEKDRLFPPQEITTALKNADINGIDVEVVPRLSHASLAVRASRRVLQQALAIARK
jgi:pimeloyl-ACP methyl ester carboxylesterase